MTLPVPARSPGAEPVRLELVDGSTSDEPANTAATAAPPKVAVVVVDSEESPIPDAEMTGRELRARLRTDQHGYVAMSAAEVRPREDASSLTVKVSAYDFCPQTVALPWPAPSLTSVTLVRAAWLDVRLIDVAGPIAALMQVQVTESGGQRRFAVDETGRCLINALQPDSPIAVSLVDRYGTTVGSPQSVTLAPGEHRRVDLMLAFDPRSLVVTVRSDSGAPLANARVGLARAGGENSDAATEIVEKTDEWGRALFSGLCLTRVDAQAVAPGHGFALERDIELLTQSTFAELTLGPAEDVVVHVADQAGQLRGPDFVGLLDLPLPVSGEAIGLGRYRLTDLPRGDVTLSAMMQGRRWDQLHTTSVPEARLVIDTPGVLEVRCDPSFGDDPPSLQLASAAHGECALWPADGRLEGSEAVLVYSVLPGTYEASLLSSGADGGKPMTTAVRITIRPDELTSVTLTRP